MVSDLLECVSPINTTFDLRIDGEWGFHVSFIHFIHFITTQDREIQVI